MEILKRLFTSRARVKLLSTFLLYPEGEFFIRELTRKLNEQINSVRRELDNLKKIGLLRSRVRNRKKYYIVNEDFIIFNELRSIMVKAINSHDEIIKKIQKFGKIDFLVLGGQFIDKESDIDMLVVGKVDKKSLEDFLNTELDTKQPIRFSIMNADDFLYRLSCKDKFIHNILYDKENIIGINKLGVQIANWG